MKIIRYLCFVEISWIVFNSVGIIERIGYYFSSPIKDTERTLFFLLCTPIDLIYDFLSKLARFSFDQIVSKLIVMAIIFIIYFIVVPFFSYKFWWKEKCLPGLWVIALAGAIIGPSATIILIDPWRWAISLGIVTSIFIFIGIFISRIKNTEWFRRFKMNNPFYTWFYKAFLQKIPDTHV